MRTRTKNKKKKRKRNTLASVSGRREETGKETEPGGAREKTERIRVKIDRQIKETR